MSLLVLASVGCSGWGDGNRTNQLGGNDAGVCTKDRDALAVLLAQPQACATSETCPTGSHCSDAGQCDWQCIADTDCGSGFTCTCDGRCVVEGGDAMDAGVTVDPSCPRQRDLLVNGTLQQACTVNANCPGGSHCDAGRCQLDTPPVDRACTLNEDCPFGSHCDTATGRCSYQCLGTTDPDPNFDCESGTVCDCLGRCVPPTGQPVDVDPNRIRMSVDKDVIEVASASWGNNPPADAPKTFELTLRADHQPTSSPTVLVRAPSGLLLLTASATWSDTALFPVWTFTLENGSYVARKTISIRSATPPQPIPTASDAPWAIEITADGVTGTPRSILVTIASAATTPGAGIYEGRVTARSGNGASIASIPVTAWATPQFILFSDPFRALSPDGMFGIHRSTLPAFTRAKWLVGNEGGSINAALMTSKAPTPQPNGDLQGGRLSAFVMVGDTLTKLDFDFDLRWRGALTAPTCTTDASCGTGHCEEELGYCAPGSDWRVSDWGNPLVSGIANQWVSAASWFLNNNTPGLFGMPSVPGQDGAGRILQCLAPDPTLLSRTSGVNAKVGFDSGVWDQMVLPPTLNWWDRSVSGELFSSKDRASSSEPLYTCMQPVPLGLNRDHAYLAGVAPTFLGQPPAGASKLEGDDLLTSCLDELFAAPPADAGSQASNAAAWFGKAAYCVSPSRLFPMLEWSFRQWDRSALAGQEARSAQSTASRWLSALSFIGDQASEQLVHNKASVLESSTVARAKVDRALTLYESSLAYLLNKRNVNAMIAMPRDVVRNPDYRVPRPVAYYTFDSEDMNGATVLDVVGKTNAKLASATYSRPSTACEYGYQTCADGILTTQLMTIPRGPAELYGDFQIAFSFQVPSVPLNGEVSLLEYGDVNDVLYQFVVANDSTRGLHIGIRHGPRTSALIHLPTTYQTTLVPGQTRHLVVRRRAKYSMTNGAAQWDLRYLVYVDGFSLHYYDGIASTQPLVTALTFPSLAQGKFNITGYANDLAFWDVTEQWGILDWRMRRRQDNFQLQPVTLANLAPRPNQDHTIGFPALLLESLARYLSTATVATKDAAGEAYASCVTGIASPPKDRAIARAGQALRYSWAAESLAARMYQSATMRSCSVDSDCRTDETCGADPLGGDLKVCAKAGAPVVEPVAWGERYTKALAELDAARAGLLREIEPIVRCEDPFGISAAAVPLYFGDPVGTSARFFASSDYLLTTWALPAVARAETSLAQAQDAWLNKRNSEIQQLLTEQQRAARLEELQTHYAQPIIELCGLTNVDPLQVINTVDPETCFQVPSPYCQGEAAQASAHCYRGELGKAVLTITSASRGVDVARRSAEATEKRWEMQNEFCAEMQVRNKSDLDALRIHNAEMNSLRSKRATANALGSMLGGLATRNPFQAIEGFAGGLSAMYERDMQFAEAAFQLEQQKRVQEQQTAQCYFEADQIKVGQDVDYAVIRQRVIDVELAVMQLQNYKSRILQLKTEARAALEREEARTVPSVAHHYWLDPKIDRYKRDFEWARRLTLLAARAVEYEFQQSLGVTGDVLQASTPNDLQQAIMELQQEQASRTINGRRPQDTSIVVSLRDDVLKISHRNGLSPAALPLGERNWSAETRFGKRLEADLFSVYDDEGNYLGQGIPFTLRETGALKYRCAERLWRVNATIQGDILNLSSPTVPVMLLKRNTSSSQWCEGHGNDTAKQMGTVYPSANLFNLQGGGTSDDESDAYTAALLMPWFNVIRSEFYKEQYVDGSSEEFAGRGLYGDYVLLFPESGLLEWTDGDPSNDFPLSRAEDVLLRFDLISVDDLQL